jgi:predicted DNA-binding transcriptional regulator AlpA
MTSHHPLTLMLESGSEPPPTRALFSPRETEAILGLSHATLYRLIGAGCLDARKLGSKTLITAASVEALIATLPKLRDVP